MKHHWWQPLLIPFTLLVYVVHLIVLPFYKPSSIRWFKGCFELMDNSPTSRMTDIWGRPGGQSWGIRVIWYNTHWDRDYAPLRVHERVHTQHGEWVNAAAHAVLVPLALLYGGDWYWLGAVALGQAAFGISYGVHFFYEWAKMGFGDWQPAYRKIWTERIAYRVDDEFEKGQRPDAWGA